jgi:hypothetical protein
MSTWTSTTPSHPSYHRRRAGGEAMASAKCARTARNAWNKAQLCAIENLASVIHEASPAWWILKMRSAF